MVVEDIREGETVGDYVSRLEHRVKELEPPEGFTIQEWHVGQVYCYLLWMPDEVREAGRVNAQAEVVRKWSDSIAMFEERFPEQVKKFADYMGWKRDSEAKPLSEPQAKIGEAT
jgi:hypothetical protein